MGFLVTDRLFQLGKFINGTLFGRKNLMLTNCLLSTGLGSLGDGIQQYYDILTNQIKDEKRLSTGDHKFNFIRNLHMSAAGFTTGLLTHSWYIFLDRYLGTKRCLKLITTKVFVDQVFFSPINLAVYFGTVSLCEKSNLKKFKEELIEKGMENIYLWEWVIWPPAQYINFYLIPLRYRMFFDNIISLGFDIYSPYVKYIVELKSDKQIEFN